MTGNTILPQTQVGDRRIFDTFIGYKIRFMTIPAIYFFVGALKFVTGQVVFEIRFVETHHVKIPPVVVAVASRATLRFYFDRGMITRLPVDPGFDLFMATQAFIVGDLLPQGMAFGTVGHSFQMSVGFCQIARG